jgi:hypothetical protein
MEQIRNFIYWSTHTMCVGHKVLMEVDCIVGKSQGILGKQLRHQPIHFLNIIRIIIMLSYVLFNY